MVQDTQWIFGPFSSDTLMFSPNQSSEWEVVNGLSLPVTPVTSSLRIITSPCCVDKTWFLCQDLFLAKSGFCDISLTKCTYIYSKDRCYQSFRASQVKILWLNMAMLGASFSIDIHPGRLTRNLQITHLERNMIFQTSMIMFHVNLHGCMFQMLLYVHPRNLG